MPIPFDRFRFLNEPRKKSVRLVNYSGTSEGEVQFDDQPPMPLPPNGDMPIPLEVQEIGVRKLDEQAPPMEIALVIEC